MTEDKEATDIESLLPSEIVAKSPEGSITVFAIVMFDQFIAVYWPEKEVFGIDYFPEQNDTSIDTATHIANWIACLPRRDFIPKNTIIADVQDLVSAAKYQTSPNQVAIAVRGGVLVWDFYLGDREAVDVEKLLPQELLADSLDGDITLFAIVGQSREVVGHYSNGGEAVKLQRDILVVKWPEKQVIGRHSVEGNNPPFVITVFEGSTMGATGDITAPTAEWILSLPR